MLIILLILIMDNNNQYTNAYTDTYIDINILCPRIACLHEHVAPRMHPALADT